MGYFRVFSPLPPTTFSSFFSGRGPGSSGRSGLGKTNILNCCPPRPAPAPSRCAWLWWLRKGPSSLCIGRSRPEPAALSPRLRNLNLFPGRCWTHWARRVSWTRAVRLVQSLEFSNFKINVLQFTQYSKRGHTSVFPFIKLPTSESHFKNQFQTLL